MKRRHFIANTAGLLSCCDWPALSRSSALTGGFVGIDHNRGHALRDNTFSNAKAQEKRTTVAIVGGGIAGLAAARQLRKAGITDYRLFELEDSVGGNSRSMRVEGFACPMGAHYLPTPGDNNLAVIELLQELKLLRIENEKKHYDERYLCHSPQERVLLKQGDASQWQEGLLPLDSAEKDQNTLASFTHQVGIYQKNGVFSIPTANAAWSATAQTLDQLSFAQWLDAQGITQNKSASLRWYLDYCCRDDYGAGAHEVSAWAGLHYFASRHGFRSGAEGEKPEASASTSDGVLTWPQGNGYLAEQLAAPHATNTQTASIVLRIQPEAKSVKLQVWNAATQQAESWQAEQLILCTPLFISKRILGEYASSALISCSQSIQYSPWIVANVYVPTPLGEWPGAARAWDNVMRHASPFNLGYVDAMHQSTRPTPASAGPTVLSCYYAFGTDKLQRTQLYERTWKAQCDIVLNDLTLAHPDIREHTKRIDIVRYGHAMAVPTPGLRSSAALAELRKPQQSRVHFAHSDLSAYSVFEEAFHWGTTAGLRVAKLVTR